MTFDGTARRRLAMFAVALASAAPGTIASGLGCSGDVFQATNASDAAADDHAAQASDAAQDDATGDDADGHDAAGNPMSAYVAAVLEDAPVGYWRLGDAKSASKAIDVRGAHDATVVKGVVFGDPGAVIGDVDTAATFGAGKLVVGDAFDFAGAAPMSVEVWMLFPAPFSATGYAEEYVVDKFENFTHGGWHLYVNSNGKLAFDRAPETDAAAIDIVQVPFTPSSKFRHVVATFDGGTCRMYVDGVLSASASCPTQLADTAAPLTFGASSTVTTSNLAGTLDEIAIYDKALSAARVDQHHRLGIGQ